MIQILILAAGKGTRMKTEAPKALVEAKGRPLLSYVLDAAEGMTERPHVVVGHKSEDVVRALGHRFIPVLQKEIKGTGSAVEAARGVLESLPARHVIVLLSDQPLVRRDSLRRLIDEREKTGAAMTLATVRPPHHDGEYAVFRANGRVVRDGAGNVSRIVEYKDASDDIRSLTEVNTSMYCFDPAWLWANLPKIQNNNASGEYYITDLVAIARENGDTVVPVVIDPIEGMGANTPDELEIIERHL